MYLYIYVYIYVFIYLCIYVYKDLIIKIIKWLKYLI